MALINVTNNFTDAEENIVRALEYITNVQIAQSQMNNISSSYPTVEKTIDVVDEHGEVVQDTVYSPYSAEYPGAFKAYSNTVSSLKGMDFKSAFKDISDVQDCIISTSSELDAFNSYVAEEGSPTEILNELGTVGDGSHAESFAITTGEDGSMSIDLSDKAKAGYAIPQNVGQTGTDKVDTTVTSTVRTAVDTVNDGGISDINNKINPKDMNNAVDTVDEDGLEDLITDSAIVLPGIVNGVFDSDPTDVKNDPTSDSYYYPKNMNNITDPNDVTNNDYPDYYYNYNYENGNKSDTTYDSPHMYNEEDAMTEYEKEDKEVEKKYNPDYYYEALPNYDKEALEEYNNTSSEIKAAGILAAVAEASNLFDNDSTALASKLADMGYNQSEIAQIMQSKDLTISAFTENYKNNLLADKAESLAQQNGDMDYVSSFRDKRLNLKEQSDSSEEKKSVTEKDDLKSTLEEMEEAKKQNMSVGMKDDPEGILTDKPEENIEIDLSSTNNIVGNVVGSTDTSGGIDLIDLGEFINPKGGVGKKLLHQIPVDFITVGVAFAIKGVNKLINGDQKQNLMINYDELAKYKYEKLPQGEKDKLINDATEAAKSIYNANKIALHDRLMEFGYNEGDINKISMTEDMTVKAFVDGARRIKLSELAKQLAAEDGITEYKSSYLGEARAIDLENGNADALGVDLVNDPEFDALRNEYYNKEKEFVAFVNGANADLAIVNVAKNNYNNFINEHGNDSGKWSNEEYKMYENLNRTTIEANRMFNSTNKKFLEIEEVFVDMRNKYEREKYSKIRKAIDPTDVKQLMNEGYA